MATDIASDWERWVGRINKLSQVIANIQGAREFQEELEELSPNLQKELLTYVLFLFIGILAEKRGSVDQSSSPFHLLNQFRHFGLEFDSNLLKFVRILKLQFKRQLENCFQIFDFEVPMLTESLQMKEILIPTACAKLLSAASTNYHLIRLLIFT